MNGYSEFDLIVEAGSSLGLWIGLSILGIFDFIIDILSKIPRVAKHFYLKIGKYYGIVQ